jgi:hypothetical protein
MERRAKAAHELNRQPTKCLKPVRGLGGCVVCAIVLGAWGCEELETGSPGDAASGSEASVAPDATSRDATAPHHQPPDAGGDRTVVSEAGADSGDGGAPVMDSGTPEAGSDDAPREATAPTDAQAGDDAPAEATAPSDAQANDAPVETTAPSDAQANDAPVETTAPSDAQASDAPTPEGGIPSCLAAGSYSIPTTWTTCNCQNTPERSTGTGDVDITIVDDPTAGWEVEWTSIPVGLVEETSPITLTASGFTSSEMPISRGSSGCFPIGGTETLELSVNCQTGAATITGSCSASFPSGCSPPNCGGTYGYYASFTGSCTYCVGSE